MDLRGRRLGGRALDAALGSLVVISLLAPAPARAFYKYEKPPGSLELTGNLRLFGAFLHFSDDYSALGIGDDGLVGGVGRLILKGNITSRVDYEAHGFFDLERAPAFGSLGGTFSSPGSFVTPYRTPWLAWAFWQSGSDAGTLGLDRARIHARLGRVDLTVGRFPINDSVAHLFTPNDFFAPFSTTAINKAYKPGVDAVRLGINLGRTSLIEVRAILGSYTSGARAGTPAWAESSVTVRASTVLRGFDVALVAGKLAERFIAGATFQGSLGPIDLRGEGHVGIPDRQGDGSGFSTGPAHGRFSAGGGWRSTWRNAYVDAEYAFYSDGVNAPAQFADRASRGFPDDQPFLGQHYVGLGAGLDAIPILRLGVLGLVNAGDGSGLAVGTLNYDISDESAVSLGLMVPWGHGLQLATTPPTLGSELGAYPITVFIESRVFF